MSSGMQSGGGEQGETSRSSTKAGKLPFDHQLLNTMTMHHTQGIEMAELVQERAAHDELKQMAKKMIDDQQQDIKMLQGMKEQWFAGKGAATNMQLPGMKESMKDMDKNKAKLKATKGQDFDALFLTMMSKHHTMMSKHHTGGIKMARQAELKDQHREVKDMAKKIANSQQKERSEMASKKKAWKLASKSS